jgi:hypothetical protein
VTLLQRSDDPVENEAWQVGVGRLQSMTKSLFRGRAGLPSYGILRLDIVQAGGASLDLA